MKNKTKIIVTSLASALVFGSIAVGGTYSLFSANADTNIAVTAGNIELSAVVGDLNLYSPALINLDGSIEDDTNIATATTFGNGGTASVRGNELTLSNIVPGDKVSTEIDIQNLSSIKTKYRFTIHASEGIELYSQLNIKINNEEILKLPYATSIDELDVGESPADKVSIEIQLPTTVGNEYANLSTKIVLSVEGYQWNTNVENYNYSLGSASDFKLFKEYSATESFEGQTIKLTSNVDLGGETFDGLYAVNREGLNRTGVAEGGFKGTFDGGNYIISNLTMGNRAAKKDSVGFFNYVNGGTVKNIKFEKFLYI